MRLRLAHAWWEALVLIPIVAQLDECGSNLFIRILPLINRLPRAIAIDLGKNHIMASQSPFGSNCLSKFQPSPFEFYLIFVF